MDEAHVFNELTHADESVALPAEALVALRDDLPRLSPPSPRPYLPGSEISLRLAALRRVKPYRRVMGVMFFLSDVLACLVAVFAAQLFLAGGADLATTLTIVACALPIYFIVALQTGAHNPAISHGPGRSIGSAGIAFAATAALFFFALYVTKIGGTVSRLQVGLTLALVALLGGTGRYLLSRHAQRILGTTPHAILCIYDDLPLGAGSGRGAVKAADVGIAPDLAQPEMVRKLGELVRGMDRVVVHCSQERRELWTRTLRCVDVRSEIVLPELKHMMPLAVRYRSGDVSLVLANGPLRWHERWTKTLFDYAFGTLALIAAAPLMLAIAIAIRLGDGGPVFFRQDRIGLGNRPFQIWKFRTMKVHFNDHLGAVSTAREDARVTRIGRFLRGTSLDELPQLFNVLARQMSIVGPRPHAPASRAEEQLFWDIDQRYWHRHSVRPGITGLAQVRGFRGATERQLDLEQRLFADLEYVGQWSLLGDLLIVVRTFRVLLHRNAF
jgi:lipopolysaccharide/colanic/teichoic acid biosynthesis glycosyltransferase